MVSSVEAIYLITGMAVTNRCTRVDFRATTILAGGPSLPPDYIAARNAPQSMRTERVMKRGMAPRLRPVQERRRNRAFHWGLCVHILAAARAGPVRREIIEGCNLVAKEGVYQCDGSWNGREADGR
jgi:hypothetical protein